MWPAPEQVGEVVVRGRDLGVTEPKQRSSDLLGSGQWGGENGANRVC